MTTEKLISTMIDDVMAGFNFERVHQVMEYLDWKWGRYGEREIPSTYLIIKTARGLLQDVMKYYGDGRYHYCATGGLRATLDDGELSLEFIMEYGVAFSEDYNTKEQ